VVPQPTEKEKVLATVEPGLDDAAKNAVGSGSVAVDVQAARQSIGTDGPVDLKVELTAEARLSKAVVAYGDVWAQPLDGKYGADAGVQVLQNLDLYAGGEVDTSGGWAATAGVKLKF
jgi:hypothetical protein